MLSTTDMMPSYSRREATTALVMLGIIPYGLSQHSDTTRRARSSCIKHRKGLEASNTDTSAPCPTADCTFFVQNLFCDILENLRIDHARILRGRLSSYRQAPLASIDMDGVLHYTPKTA